MSQKLTGEDLQELLKLRKMISTMTSEEYIVFSYLWDNISVGEILFEKDLIVVHKIRKPALVARSLREKGLAEYGDGCYNLPRWLRRLRMQIGRFDELKRLLESLPHG